MHNPGLRGALALLRTGHACPALSGASAEIRGLQRLPHRLPTEKGRERQRKEPCAGNQGTRGLALWLWASHSTYWNLKALISKMERRSRIPVLIKSWCKHSTHVKPQSWAGRAVSGWSGESWTKAPWGWPCLLRLASTSSSSSRTSGHTAGAHKCLLNE